MNSINDVIDRLSTDGVVPPGVVIGGILLPSDHLLGVEELAVLASSNLIFK